MSEAGERLIASATEAVTMAKLMAENARLREALRQAVGLIDAMMTNDPNEPVSDAGHTCLDLWKAKTEELRAVLDGK